MLNCSVYNEKNCSFSVLCVQIDREKSGGIDDFGQGKAVTFRKLFFPSFRRRPNLELVPKTYFLSSSLHPVTIFLL